MHKLKKHVFYLLVTGYMSLKKKRLAWHRRTDKGGHTERRIVKGDFVSRLMSRPYISLLRASNRSLNWIKWQIEAIC